MASLPSLLSSPWALRHADTIRWTHDHWGLCLGTSAVYVLGVFLGPRLMRDRAPVRLPALLVLWNAALALFSLAASMVLLPELVMGVRRGGWVRTWCRMDGYFDGVTGFWAFLFLLSKIAELGDTVFLVLRKRPVIFLHW